MVIGNKEEDGAHVPAGVDLRLAEKPRLSEKPDALAAISRSEGLRHIDFERYGKSIDAMCVKSGLDALLDNPFALAAWARAKESLGHYYDALNLSRLAHSFFGKCGNREAELDELIFQSGIHLALSDIGTAETLIGQIPSTCQSDSHRLFPVSLLRYRLFYAKGDQDGAEEALSHLEQLSASPASSILSRGYRLQAALQSGTVEESALARHYDIEANDPSYLQLPPQIMRSYHFTRVIFSQVLASSGYLNRASALLPPADALPESMRPQALLASALVCMGRKDCAQALSLLQGGWKHRPHGLSHGELGGLYWYEALCALAVMSGKDASEIVQRSTSPLMISGAGGLQARSTLLNAFCCCMASEMDRAAVLLHACRDYGDIDSDVCRFLSFSVETLCALEDKDCETYIDEMTGKCRLDDVLPRGAYLVAATICGIRPVLLQVLVAIFGLKALSFDFLGLIDRRKCSDGFGKNPSLLSAKDTGDLDMRLVAVGALSKGGSSRVPEKLYRIRVLGALSIGVDGREIDIKHWRKSKARELFTFIVLHAGRDIARESLMEIMWPDMPSDKARNNYYVTWSNLKRILTSGSEELAALMPVASSGARCYVCDDRCDIDIVELLAEITAAHNEAASQNFSEAIRHYHRVAHLYRGDILPGDMYNDWLSAIREHYHTLYVETMISATQTCLQQHEHANAIFFIERALHFEKNREVLYDLAMRAFLEAGRREDAISTYHTCRHFLSEELGLDPSREIKKLYNEAISA